MRHDVNMASTGESSPSITRDTVRQPRRHGFLGFLRPSWSSHPGVRSHEELTRGERAAERHGVGAGGVLDWVTPDRAGCVDWGAIRRDGLTFTKETIMQFRLAHAAPGALLWVLEGDRQGELYEVDAQGLATHVGAEAFATDQAHYREVWANVIPVSTAQLEDVAARGMVAR